MRKAGRTILTEFESKELLTAYGIPTVETRIAANEEEAVKAADRNSAFPVVLKLHSETITHKTDVGGVQLNCPDAGRSAARGGPLRDSCAEKVGRRTFPRRDRAADGQAGWL